MKIPATLPQFDSQVALLVVTGKQGATFYIGANGEIASAGSFEVRLPRRTERAGLFIRRGRGRVLASGSVREPNKTAHAQEFLRQLASRLRELATRHQATASYLYAPTYLMKQAKAALAKTLGRTYVMSFSGHYQDRHPLELLRMIAARSARRAGRRRVVPLKREAATLLERR
jgi:hypothetical protein